MKRLLIAIALTVLAVIIILGVREMLPRRVASHTFSVPSEYRREEGVFWIPNSQNIRKFVLNPRSRTEDQVLVSVESYVSRCPNQAQTNFPVCDALDFESLKAANFYKDSLTKSFHQGGEASWTYRIRQQGQDRAVASCFSSMTGEARGGFCSSRVRYGDLLISLRYRENMVSNLPSLVDEIIRKIADWARESPRNNEGGFSPTLSG